MTSIDFLKKTMEKAALLFPLITIKYDYIDNTHVIDINTESLNNNDPYFDFELNFLADFTSQFPEEDLVFITCEEDKDLYDMNGSNIFYHRAFKSKEYRNLNCNNVFIPNNYNDFQNSINGKSISGTFSQILSSYFKGPNKSVKIINIDTNFTSEDSNNKDAA